MKKDEKMEFEVGKWYEVSNWSCEYYIKLKKKEECNGYSRIYGETIKPERGIPYYADSYMANRKMEDRLILLEDLSKIQEYLPDGHPDKVKENEYIVGAWYKIGNWRVKFTGLDGNKFQLSIAITPNDGYVSTSGGHLNLDFYEKPELMTDLSEIQQYLPEGHPDKTDNTKFILPEKWCCRIDDESRNTLNYWRIHIIKYDSKTCTYDYMLQDGSGGFKTNGTEITFEQFKKYVLRGEFISIEKYIPGNIYRIEEGTLKCICKFEKMRGSSRMSGYYISNMNGEWEFKHSTPWIIGRTVVDATKEESEWLEACIKADKFIHLDDFRKSNEISIKPRFKAGDDVVICSKEDDIDGNGFMNKDYSTEQIDGVSERQFQILRYIEHNGNIYYEYGGYYIKESCLRLIESKADKKMESDEFILPEKWCIKVTKENVEALGRWRRAGRISNGIDGYCLSFYRDVVGWYTNEVSPEFKEITYEQFKKHVLKQEGDSGEKQYYPDLSQHIGRYIKALVDYPHSGDVKKDEIGIIIDSSTVNFPSQSPYRCTKALTKDYVDKYELMPEDYKPSVDYKIGDWCYIIDNGGSRLNSNEIYQINDIDGRVTHFDNGTGKKDNSCWLRSGNFRLATDEEIKAKTGVIKKSDTTKLDFKVGDNVTIKFMPESWSSACIDESPMSLKYPFTGKIEEILDREDHIAANIGGYGFSLSNLIKEDNIILNELNPVVDEWTGWWALMLKNRVQYNGFMAGDIVKITSHDNSDGGSVYYSTCTNSKSCFNDGRILKFATKTEAERYWENCNGITTAPQRPSKHEVEFSVKLEPASQSTLEQTIEIYKKLIN